MALLRSGRSKQLFFKTIIDFCTVNREEIKQSHDVVAWCLADSDTDDDSDDDGGNAQDFEVVLSNKFSRLVIEGESS
ncbi:hypothetical protein K2X40_02190 [Candidatus Babeliales bacterium]|nr:hypothetical protein [Candidatus Babeliales bacterium]